MFIREGTAPSGLEGISCLPARHSTLAIDTKWRRLSGMITSPTGGLRLPPPPGTHGGAAAPSFHVSVVGMGFQTGPTDPAFCAPDAIGQDIQAAQVAYGDRS